MRIARVSASLLALAVFAGPASAAETSAASRGEIILAQAAGNPKVDEFLSVRRAPASLPADRLQKRLTAAKAFLARPDISDDQRTKLQQVIAAVEAELAKRNAAKAQGGQEQPAAQAEVPAQPEAGAANANKTRPKPVAADNTEITAFLSNAVPLKQMSVDELRNRARKAVVFSQTRGITPDTRQKLRQVALASRNELQSRQAAGNAGGEQTAGQQPAQNQQSSPAAEAQARQLLNDQTPADRLNNQDLRKRLLATRELLATRQLSPATNAALRQKLARDRQVLRARVDGNQNAGGNTPNKPTNGGNEKINITVILNDRRPPADLRDAELQRRIDIYRGAVLDARYAERERQLWRQALAEDRRVLRQRLLDQRQRRQRDLTNVNIDIGLNFPVNRRPPPSVFAAEADEDDLEAALAAPPRQKLERRYTIDEVERSPELRNAVARIEIDTVRFGFGESFLREEEVQSLDRIAELMEKILAAHPREVFMIEGHTDAVGSDASNQALSLERARAVKEALTTYFVIPPANLKPVGFGERYLKIPTPDAEQENRRVSIARITDLVGELDR